MRLSVKELCKKFNISQSKIYTIIGRPEMQKFFAGREHNTRYIEVNEESQAIIEKWANRRTKKDGTYEVTDRGTMARIRIGSMCRKYGYSYTTMRIVLCRGEFDKYRDAQGRLIIWNKEAENKFLKIMELKQGRNIYGYSG